MREMLVLLAGFAILFGALGQGSRATAAAGDEGLLRDAQSYAQT